MTALPVFANDADDVLKTVIPATRGMVMKYDAAPAVFSSTTRGGAMHTVEEFIWNTRPKGIAAPLADSYYKENQAEHDISADLPEQVRVADLRALEQGHEYDWARFSEQFPRANSVVVFSEPAFDSLGTTAMVRAEVITPDNKGYMAFWTLEKQALDGSWKMKNGSIHPREGMFRTDIHAGHLPKQCPVPDDQRHPAS